MKTISHLKQSMAALSAVILMAVQIASAASFDWTGAGADDFWATAANWNPSGPPGTADSPRFGDTDTVGDALTVNNVVGASATVAALSYTNSTSGAWHVTEIPSGNTLTVTGGVTIGGGSASNLNTAAAMVGGGTLLVTGGNYAIGNTFGSLGLLPVNHDLSGLSNFVYNVSGGTFGFVAVNRSSGTLSLAGNSNRITAATLNAGTGSTSSSGTSNMRLGSGTNIINVTTLNLAAGRMNCNLNFPTADGGLRIRGVAGGDNDRATTVLLGHRNTGSSTGGNTTGTFAFNGHPVDIKIGNLTLGQMSRAGTEGGLIGTGNFQFDQGSVDATTINMGICNGASPTPTANGTFTMGGGTLLVGNISLVNVSSTGASATGSGTLNVNGGTATCAGNITKTTTTGTGTIAVNTGSLAVQGLIGSVTIPVDNLTLSDANLTLSVGATTTNTVVVNLTTGGSTNVINISSVPAVTGYPAQFPVISYVGAIGGAGFDNNVGLGSLPAASPSYVGFLSNNIANATIDLVITGGPAPAQPIRWSGAVNGNWDTATLNWLAGITPTNYNNAGDFVTFPDVALNTTVSLVTPTLTPGSITVSNQALPYTFTGTGKLSGSTGLTKQGSGTLTIANSVANDFAGAITLTAGALNFNQTISATVGNSISGAGAVIKSGANTLTLSGINSYSGGLTVSNGVLRATSTTAPGSTTVTVYSGGTFVAGATQTNTYTLAGGAFGIVSGAMNNVPGELTAAGSTTSTLYLADPQNLGVADATEIAFTNTWHGSGNISVLTVTNDNSPDGGNGFRLRGTASSDFSGTVTFGNNVKGELQTSVAGPFSPGGTGKFVLTCGVYNGTNGLLAPPIGGYSELNLRNNSTGDTVLGNDLELTGSGLALINPLGSAPADAKVTMGNLRLGGGQELGVYLNSGNRHIAVFPTVTLTGGSVRFSPKTPDFGSLASVGSDLSLGDISQTAASSITMNGVHTLFITGTSTHSGSTTVSNGTLHLSGALNGGGALTVSGGTLAGNGSTAGSVTVNSAGTISPGASVGKFTATGAVTLLGTNVMEIDRDAGTNDVLQGSSVAYGGTLVISNLTSALQAGDSFKLFNAAGYSGSFSSIVPAEPGAGLTWNTSALVTTGTLSVSGAAEPTIASISIIGGNLVFSGANGPANAAYEVLTSTDVLLPLASWTVLGTANFDGSGNFSFTNGVPSDPQRFYILRMP